MQKGVLDVSYNWGKLQLKESGCWSNDSNNGKGNDIQSLYHNMLYSNPCVLLLQNGHVLCLLVN